MKELSVSYNDLMWRIPWGTVLRMMADLPRQVKESEVKENRMLTEETAEDFKAYIDQLNRNKKN